MNSWLSTMLSAIRGSNQAARKTGRRGNAGRRRRAGLILERLEQRTLLAGTTQFTHSFTVLEDLTGDGITPDDPVAPDWQIAYARTVFEQPFSALCDTLEPVFTETTIVVANGDPVVDSVTSKVFSCPITDLATGKIIGFTDVPVTLQMIGHRILQLNEPGWSPSSEERKEESPESCSDPDASPVLFSLPRPCVTATRQAWVECSAVAAVVAERCGAAIASARGAQGPQCPPGRFIVNDTRDLVDDDRINPRTGLKENDGKCDVDLVTRGQQCTLRAAIENVNKYGSRSPKASIRFKPEITLLEPTKELPTIRFPVAIDGLEGRSARVVISGKQILGISADGLRPLRIRIEGSGIEVGSSQTIVGGVSSGAGNVISSHDNGIFVSPRGGLGPVAGTQILGNRIGTNKDGNCTLDSQQQCASGNFFSGIDLINAADTIIGGAPLDPTECDGACNIISGNGSGIKVTQSVRTQILGNFIGTQSDGSSALGNYLRGVNITGTRDVVSDTRVESNRIAFNLTAIRVVEGLSIAILGNSIFSNVLMGIDLIPGNVPGVTPNDEAIPPDGDKGPNNLQNFPTDLTVSGRTISGRLLSTPGQTFRIDLFTSDQCSNENPQGFLFIGSTRRAIKTDKDTGAAEFTFIIPIGQPIGAFLTATATEARGGNTSEFSACFPVPAGRSIRSRLEEQPEHPGPLAIQHMPGESSTRSALTPTAIDDWLDSKSENDPAVRRIRFRQL